MNGQTLLNKFLFAVIAITAIDPPVINAHAQKRLSFTAVVLDQDSTESTSALGITNQGQVLVKSNSGHFIAESDGTLTPLSTYAGTDRNPLHMNLKGDVIFTAALGADGCDVLVFSRSRGLTSYTLPVEIPCNAVGGRLSKQADLFALLAEEDTVSFVKKQYVVLYSNGKFRTQEFSGFQPGRNDQVSFLAGFSGQTLVTNFVSGSTTPIYVKTLFGLSRSRTLETDSRPAVPFSFLAVTNFANSRNTLLADQVNGCATYTATLSGSLLTRLKRIRQTGSCTDYTDINKSGEVSGILLKSSGFTLFTWNQNNRFRDVGKLIVPARPFTWDNQDTFINDRGDIVAYARENEKTFPVLLIKNK
jgi:hypothetical protein